MSASDWTPDRLNLEIESATAATTILNQNYDPGWRLTKGTGSLAPTDFKNPRNALMALSILPENSIWFWSIAAGRS